MSIKAMPKCEIKHTFACNGIGIRKMIGVKKGDPKFYCCFGCEAMLKRAGVRMKEYKS